MKRLIITLIIVVSGLDAFSQKTRELTGIFMLEGEGMPGATIIVESDYQNGTITDIEGRFKLKVPAERKFQLTIGMCICTSHHNVIINENDAEVFLTIKKCKGKKKTLKKIK